MGESANQVIERARTKVLEGIVNTEAIMTEDARKALIERAMSAAMGSMSGIANVHRPPALRKETTRTINSVLHQWKSYMDPHVHSTLELRPEFSDAHPTSSSPEEDRFLRANRVSQLLQSFDFLRKNPTDPLFSAKYFQDCIVDHLYLRTPVLWPFVDRAAPHVALDNLFALGAAAAAAAMRDYQEGKRDRRELTSPLWRPDYHRARVLIQQIRADEGESLRLDRLQQWMLAQRRVEVDEPV